MTAGNLATTSAYMFFLLDTAGLSDKNETPPWVMLTIFTYIIGH